LKRIKWKGELAEQLQMPLLAYECGQILRGKIQPVNQYFSLQHNLNNVETYASKPNRMHISAVLHYFAAQLLH
jgi:hypothetical protein